MRNVSIFLILIVAINWSSQQTKNEQISAVQEKTTEKVNWNKEIIYHMIQRSFYDRIVDMSTIGTVTQELMTYRSDLRENSIKLGAHGFLIAQLKDL